MKLTPRKIEKAKEVLKEDNRQRFLKALEHSAAIGDSLMINFQFEGWEPTSLPIVFLPDGTWQEAEEYYAKNPVVPSDGSTTPNPHVH